MCQANLNTATWVTSAVVAMPPSTRRGGLLAWTIAPSQVRQAYFGKIVRFTRTVAGTTSRASRVSSPIRWSAPEQQGQTVVSGSITSSQRGRCLGRAPILRTAGRRGRFSLRSATPSSVAEGWARRPDRAGAGRRRSPPPAPSGLRRGDPSRCARSPASARFPYPAPAPAQPDEPGRRAHPQGGSAYLKVTRSEPVSPWESIRSPHPKGPSHRSRRDPRPIEAINQHRELRGGQSNDPALDRRPGEAPLLEPLGREDQTGAVKSQDLHAIGSLGSEDKDRPRIRVLAQALGHEPCKRIHSFAEVHGLSGNQYLQIGADGDHARARRVAS